MKEYFFKRLLLIPPTLLGVTIIVFAITRLVPGGPLERAIMESQMMDASGSGFSQSAGQGMAISEAHLEQLKAYYGFDKPVIESYLIWTGKVLTGDLGSSYRYNEPVWDVIKARFPVSIYYGLITLVLTYLVCIPLGVLSVMPFPDMPAALCYCCIFRFAWNGSPWAALSALPSKIKP